MSLLEITQLRLRTIEDQRINPFIDSIIVDEFIKEVEDPLKALATGEGLAQSYIDSISTVKLGFCTVALKMSLERDGKPLGIWLEKGTKQHWIEPKDPINGPFALHWTYQGKSYFSKGHMHPGFEGYHILDMVPFLYIPRFEKKIATRTNEYLERTSLK